MILLVKRVLAFTIMQIYMFLTRIVLRKGWDVLNLVLLGVLEIQRYSFDPASFKRLAGTI
jgi:hypothetical protein